MEEINPFDQISDSSLVDENSLKKMLVSEIDFIRDALGLVNMFLGESMKTAAIGIQEMQSSGQNQ